MTEDISPRKFVTKNEAVILRAVSDATQARIADAMGGKQASYISRFLSGEQKLSWEEFLILLDVTGVSCHRVSEESLIVARAEWAERTKFSKLYWQMLDDGVAS